ncbi:hypothetical protein PCASD_16685 [Puccinia coronata f. sp. avenae]|uniref:Uncharacterized protein n=1 Tax=Puccinia coronata f. sp. avenae TaxID=200324 RepID=A0A2N5T8A2_9BASI|nr:hypothetical protein PCASD_16685 [Puccinia coronata f. sp. avenae]
MIDSGLFWQVFDYTTGEEIKPPNRESGIASGTASGSALPLPSKTRRSRHKYSSRSRPSID